MINVLIKIVFVVSIFMVVHNISSMDHYIQEEKTKETHRMLWKE